MAELDLKNICYFKGTKLFFKPFYADLVKFPRF